MTMQNEWQPIETAPKDGTSILIATEDGLVTEVFFEDENELRIARVYGKENAALIAEAGTLFQETGLTPRQLLKQRDELRDALFHLYDYARYRGHDDDFPLQISILIRQSYEAALAKCGKVGG